MSNLKLAGKVAVITGGNSGIGLAAALEFKAQGASVVIAGRDESTLRTAAESLGGDTVTVRADVAKLEDIDRLYSVVKERFGRIDVLFANAGVGGFTPIAEFTEEKFDTLVDVNFKGLFFTVTKALPLLSKGASIVLTSSVLHQQGMPGASVYSATKAAVRSLARTFAAELVDRGIRVNVLSPGPIETPIFAKLGLEGAAREGFNAHILAKNPMKRFGKPEEMAKAALFLASADSSYLTGADILADGGAGQI